MVTRCFWLAREKFPAVCGFVFSASLTCGKCKNIIETIPYAASRFFREFSAERTYRGKMPQKNGKGRRKLFMKKIGALFLALLLSLSLAGAPAPAGAETQIPIRGIDVSRYQGDVDWAAVAGSGVQFAMLRVVCSSDRSEDVRFEENYAEAVQNGVKVGAYVYTYATDAAGAAADADACLQYLDGRTSTTPLRTMWRIPARRAFPATSWGKSFRPSAQRSRMQGTCPWFTASRIFLKFI